MSEIEGKLCPLHNHNWVTLKQKEKEGLLYKCIQGDVFVKTGDSIRVEYSIRSEKEVGKTFEIDALKTPERLRRD